MVVLQMRAPWWVPESRSGWGAGSSPYIKRGLPANIDACVPSSGKAGMTGVFWKLVVLAVAVAFARLHIGGARLSCVSRRRRRRPAANDSPPKLRVRFGGRPDSLAIVINVCKGAMFIVLILFRHPVAVMRDIFLVAPDVPCFAFYIRIGRAVSANARRIFVS